LGRREQDGEGRHQHQEAGAKLACRHHPDVGSGITAGRFPRDHQQERQAGNNCEGDDEVRPEPVIDHAPVEHDFERAEKGRDQHEADEIKTKALLF
jgi:hypothetical protein